MALIGYSSKCKNTPPPVESLKIYRDTNSLVSTGEAHISIRSQQLISMVLVSKSDGDATSESMPVECRKHTERSPTPSDGEQFRVWRSSDSKLSKRERPVVENREMPQTSKPLKNMSRSKSLSPQWSSDKRKTSSMKRSATFSGKITKSKITKTSKLNDYRNAKIKNETGSGTTWMTRIFYVLTLFMLLFVVVKLVWINSSQSALPYNHSEVLINTTGLQKYLQHNFFGQRYAIKFLHEILQVELNGEKHKRPLILSFHGGPGVGKTFLTEAITKHLFTNGLDSQCVHNFISSLHIRNVGDNINHDIIAEFLLQSTYIRCPLQLFIIDNMEILSPHLVNYISQSIQTSLSDSSRVKSIIVIFASTLGGKQIFKMRDCSDAVCYLQTTKMLKKELSLTWTSEKTLDVDKVEYNFLHSSEFFVFFPLKRQHIKLCVQHVLQQYLPSEKITDELLERVASEISFVYVGEKGYSSSGCKQVAEKVMLHL
ncbi:torsin-1A-like [Anneissia japonica]|uniref:torsin-1A-like n=1 Tax=Anneissia japonica TaxID=1529436 RepID=UPI0014255A83|nr:torsin-1A-like [Anneissia japonica]XP_033108292.1 torsin-1A-like [Anneissia japonica]